MGCELRSLMAAASPRDWHGGMSGEALPSAAESAPSPEVGSTSEASPLDSAAASGEHERGLDLHTLRDGNAAVPPSRARVSTAMDLRMGR